MNGLIDGLRLAITGMGRSGIAAAIAAAKRGANVRVYDERSADTPVRMANVDLLEAHGIDVVTGWHGRLQDEAFDELLTSPGFRRDHPALRDARSQNRPVISEVEFAYRISQAPMIAITGTNGKSTVTAMTWLILRANHLDAVLCGNISGSGYNEKTLTEAADQSLPGQWLVAEVSSYQLEWVQNFRPRVATVTNVTPDHFDRHPDFDDYFRTKLRLFDRMDAGDTVVFNGREPSVLRESIQAHCGAACEILEFPCDRLYVDQRTLSFYGSTLPIDELPVLGQHNVTNAMNALALAHAAIKPWNDAMAPKMLDALRDFQPLSHRMERIGSKHGVQIVNNSMCTNPGALIASSQALELPHYLLMGGNMKGLDFKPVGDYLRSRPDVKPIVFSEFGERLLHDMGISAPVFESMAEAFAHAVERAQPSEMVMLAPGCASAFPYENFRERGDAFRLMAQEWLNS